MNDSQLLNGLACAAISLSLNLLFQNNQSVDPEIKNILSILPNLLIKICSKNNLSNRKVENSLIRQSSSSISSIENSPDSSNYYAEDERPASTFIDSRTGVEYREVVNRIETPKKKIYFNNSFPRNLIQFSPRESTRESPRESPRYVERVVLENITRQSTPRTSKRNNFQAFSTPIKNSVYNRSGPIQIDERSFLRSLTPKRNKTNFNDFSIKSNSKNQSTDYVDMRPQLSKLKRQINFDLANDDLRPGTSSRRKNENENENFE